VRIHWRFLEESTKAGTRAKKCLGRKEYDQATSPAQINGADPGQKTTKIL
jgi:hypothetical protein